MLGWTGYASAHMARGAAGTRLQKGRLALLNRNEVGLTLVYSYLLVSSQIGKAVLRMRSCQGILREHEDKV